MTGTCPLSSQAVKKYVETKDFEAVDAAKRDVLTIYRNDIFNYAGELADKVVSIFDQIPSQLSKHEKKFRLSALKPGAKYRDWDDAFFWLKDARVVNRLPQATSCSSTASRPKMQKRGWR